jgi:hypothetical protein
MDIKGTSIKGFKFDPDKTILDYNPLMDKYVGLVGVVTAYIHITNSIQLTFFDGSAFFYPYEEALNHVVRGEYKPGQKFLIEGDIYVLAYKEFLESMYFLVNLRTGEVVGNVHHSSSVGDKEIREMADCGEYKLVRI